MRRSIGLAFLALGLFALGLVPSALAQDPSITTTITFPDVGEPFGTFEAEEPLCSSGTFTDEFVGGGGAFRSGRPFHGFTVRKTFVCADESGTFTVLFHPQFNPNTALGCEEAGPFSVIGGTGAFSELRGHGKFCLVPGDQFHETFTGTFSLG